MRDIDIRVSVDNEDDTEETGYFGSYFFSKMPLVGKVSYAVFFLTVSLLPLFMLPSSWGFQMEFSKKFFFSTGILLAFGLWLITKLEDGNIRFPGGAVFWTGALLLSSFFFSSLFSPAPGLSFLGVGYENDTFVSILLLFLAMFLAGTFFESEERFYNFFWVSIFGSLAIGLIELAQIFSGGKVFSGGILVNMIGKWNDLGIFFGLAFLLSQIGLELASFDSGRAKKVFWLLFVVSAVIMTFVNYTLIWGTVGLFSLAILLYSRDREGLTMRQMIFRPSFAAIIISLILFFGFNIAGPELGKFGLYQLEVRPSWQSTVSVARQEMQKNLFLGNGPNTFSAAWASLKPDAVNSTVFWNTDFNVGFGRIPTYAVTLGLLGLISSSLFLASIFYYGLRAVMASFDDTSDCFMVLTSCLGCFYLWAFSIFYSTDSTLFSLTFVWTGVFLASLFRVGLVRNYEINFFGSPKLNFISVLAIVLAIIFVITGGYMLSRKFLALRDFQKGLYEMNVIGDSAAAETAFKNATALDEEDVYYRSLADMYLARLKNLIDNQSGIPRDALVRQFQDDLSGASGSARRATELDGADYLNWVALGKVGEAVLPLKNTVSGGYDLAFNSYSRALALNSKDPNLYLSLGRVEISAGDTVKALNYLDQAIAMKSNLTEALFLQSQIEASQGNLPGAIKKAEQAAIFSPGDAGLLFQLGFLRYMAKDYSGAIDALQKAVGIQPDYANAKYFLGLCYSKFGRTSDAIKEFEDVMNMNPGNTEVENILKNLRAGRGALDNITAPKNQPKEPSKRSKPPVNE